MEESQHKRDYKFTDEALDQLMEWADRDRKVAKRIHRLAKECARTPHEGTGKPEPLKGKDYQGYWSRRIDDTHRLIYRVDNTTVFIVSCHGHYGDK